ncbi:MAG: transporter substrate-binding domain-containing protein [Deferribacteraceae bacterium]|jgi:PAS domain S-box-containing protein|nr:transporter substrate-binding domain-containing protein [Deferribacteraceae bacterium]
MKANIIRTALFLIFLGIASVAGYSQPFPTQTDNIRSVKYYSNIPGVTDDEIAEIEKLKSQKESFSYGSMLTTESFILEDGSYDGFTTLFCELLSELFNIPFVQEFYTWDHLKSGVDSNDIDFTGEISLTPEHQERYFMTLPIAERSFKVFTNSNSFKIETEQDLYGLRVGFLEDTISDKSILNFYNRVSFDAVNIKNIHDAVAMLNTGAIDAFITDSVMTPVFDNYPSIYYKNFLPLLYASVSMATANPEFEAVISVMGKYLAAGGVDILHDLYKTGEQGYEKYKLRKSFTEEEKAYLNRLAANEFSVRIAVEHDNYPISFYNKKDNKFQGIAMDILEEISKLTGISFDIATGPNTLWTEIIERLEIGDIAMVTELQYSEERKNNFIWSNIPYFISHYALLSKDDYKNLDISQIIRSSIGFVKGTAVEDMYNTWFGKTSVKHTMRYSNYNDALDALENGEIDLLMASDYSLLLQMNYREKSGYKINVMFHSPEVGSFFGFNRNEYILKSIISKAQNFVNVDKINNYWSSRVFDYSRKYAEKLSLYMIISAVVLFLTSIVLIILFAKNLRISDRYKKQLVTLSAIYKSLPDLVFCKNIEGKYISCNESFEKFYGLKEAEIVGKTDLEIFAKDEKTAQNYMQTDQVVMKEKILKKWEVWSESHDNTRRLFESVKTPLIQEGNVIGLLGISKDITEHKMAEETAQAATKAKSEFLAHISHEIRTPMNTIMGMSELILQEEISDKAHEYALLCKRAGTNMLAIINDILDFSKIEAGKLEIRIKEYSFASFINDTVNIIRTRISDKPILFTVNIDCNIPMNMVGDDLRFKEILINLLSNAVKYTKEGFINLSMKSEMSGKSVILTTEVSDSGIGIKEENIRYIFEHFSRVDLGKTRSIEGTGLGLAITKKLCNLMNGDISLKSEYGVGSTFTVTLPQEVKRYKKLAEVENPERKSVLIYEPRLVYARSLAQTFENLGVRYVFTPSRGDFYDKLNNANYSFIFISSFIYKSENQLQKLKADSKIILITEFDEVYTTKNIHTISMPAHSFIIANILNDKTDNTIYKQDKLSTAFVAPSARILIVDDLGTNLTVAEGLMSRFKMQIDTCKSGAEAVKLVEENMYDIIFMDHAMPGMDGIETTQAIRALKGNDRYYKNVPIIAMTANAISGMKEMYLNNGMNDYLSKPIEIAKLDNMLKKWIPDEKQNKENGQIKNEKNSAPEIKIEGIDVQVGLLMNGGITENYIRTLNVFCRDGWEKLDELKECIAKNDIKLYTIFVHGLKNALWNVGAKKLSDFAKTLENAGKNGTSMFIMEYNDLFLTELETLLQNISVVIAESNEEKIELDKNGADLLKESLTMLRAALENMEAEQINIIMKNLDTGSWDKNSRELLNNLLQNILLFEYEKAIALIDAMY